MAIYWPPAGSDDYGKPAQGALVELVGGFVVRWEDVVEDFTTKDGTASTSSAVVYVPLLPDGSEVAVGGFLWLGARAGLTDEADPTANAGAHEVRRMDKLPTLKATEFLRTCYL